MRFIIKESRKTDYPNPIKLRKGQKVKLLKHCSEEGWEKWVKCDDGQVTGWIPQEIIEFNSTETGILQEDYDATELNVTKGNTFISNKTFCGWAWGVEECKEQEGWVPINILEEKITRL